MYYTYILRSDKDKNLYVGYTSDLRRRIQEHNNGKTFSTSHRRPLFLIYYEAYINEDDAKQCEKFLKTGWGRNYIKKTLRNYFKGIKF
ncbi:MAG: excinuclease ABC subunit C [Candidatus Staskawiczbacteria bacterium RIFCSPHIGHO2_01_FULL_34_27]|uniref:Excinuclease ABC subunit C n=2 Tax=Candidatus Staskawicziibacteriota TaxID=1817916 RepID=A0A1G2HKU9_9BACT|nr:MAG: Excinuclease ABC C subunit domain protein [Parcubacteria group bacterium GW2011_GWA2_33_14]OGZ63075.1 MAG: excinuclease ABC subunit C [Candidatus Staskawiczbacteria bacterium RIFCSPHIGHO2_01_FULL_34_27]OGZ65790.1 MAG: excinuclease ABC subunit C [Candidatus Staskawiczbacteria bacterium RIFCSPHIGHO2_02_FULL_33_16]